MQHGERPGSAALRQLEYRAAALSATIRGHAEEGARGIDDQAGMYLPSVGAVEIVQDGLFPGRRSVGRKFVDGAAAEDAATTGATEFRGFVEIAGGVEDGSAGGCPSIGSVGVEAV